MTTRPKRRETTERHRLCLECHCGVVQTLWVHPDMPVKLAARQHGWVFHTLTGWVCPVCGEDVP